VRVYFLDFLNVSCVLKFSVLYACFHVLPCWRNERCYSLPANRFAAPRPLAISCVHNVDDVMPALSVIVNVNRPSLTRPSPWSLQSVTSSRLFPSCDH